MRSIPSRSSVRAALVVVIAVLAAASPSRAAGDPQLCDDPGEAPNVIVGDINNWLRWGGMGGQTAFSIGTISCNVGSCWAEWIADTPAHPVIAQNMYRLEAGRFEQVGQSWVKHAQNALAQDLCATCLDPSDGTHLGVNCSDPYGAYTNGSQRYLGRRSEVNPHTGEIVFPPTDWDVTGDDLYKRLIVTDAEVDEALHPTAQFFAEAEYVTADDARAGNQNDNASWRPVRIYRDLPGLQLDLLGATVRTQPAVMAWAASDPGVRIQPVDVPDDGRLFVAAKATDLGGGRWGYEYAVHNLNCNRAVSVFSVPIPVGAVVTSIGFHDIDYHSGEAIDGTDWACDGGANGFLTWSTQPFADNPSANAIRWGTLYNFRFETNVAPTDGEAALGLFRPGTPSGVLVATVVPEPCNHDGTCDPSESCLNCADDCPLTGPDRDSDGVSACEDCDDADPEVWATPGEARDLRVAKVGSIAELTWSPPVSGALRPWYDCLRSEVASDFATSLTCLSLPSPRTPAVADPADPIGGVFFYLARARVPSCAVALGPLGDTSRGMPRTAPACP